MTATQQELLESDRLAAAMLDHILQARDEGQFTLQLVKDLARVFALHQQAVSQRHAAMFHQLSDVTATLKGLVASLEQIATTVQANTRARENAEWEIAQLHSVMGDWHRAAVAERRLLEAVLGQLDMREAAQGLPPPLMLPAHVQNHRKAS